MDPQIALVITIIVISLILFATERFPSDVIALGIVVVLILTGLLTTKDAFAGFGSDAVMMILGLLIMTASLMRTGVVELAGRFIFQLTGDQPKRISLIIMATASGLSSFMSNAATTAFFLPIVIGLAHRAKVSPAKFLMPLAFASILASSVTLIATSTNIVVSGLITQYGLAPLGVFELTPVGIPILLTGLIYMYFIGSRLIPDRIPPEPEKQTMGRRIYVTEMIIKPNSSFVGKMLAETALGRDLDIQVLRVVREERRYLSPSPDLRFEAGDVLLVECERSEIIKVQDLPGVDIKADHTFSPEEVASGEIGIIEVILLPGSPFIGRTLRGLHARERFGLQVLAVNRYGEPIRQKLSSIRMHLGDVLLVQGNRSNIDVLEQQSAFRILDDTVEAGRPDLRRAPRAVLIFVVALLLAALQRRAAAGGGARRSGGFVHDALHHARRSLPTGRLESADPDRQHVGARSSDGTDWDGGLPCSADRQRRRHSVALDRLGGVLPAHRRADAALARGGSHRRAAGRHSHGAAAWAGTAHLRDHDRRRRDQRLSDAARSRVSHGLWSRTL